MTTRGQVSFWYQDIGLPQSRRPKLEGARTADVVIIGAGYSGLWSAYYLKQHDPSLRVIVLEKSFAGFGASGRNGGWLTGGFAWNHTRYAQDAGDAATKGLVRAMGTSVDEIIAVCETHGIDADIRRCDELVVATNPAQWVRLQDEIQTRRDWGEEDRVRAISATEARARVRVPSVEGGMIVENCARIQPAKLVRGLADAVERLGVEICENSEVLSIAPGRVMTDAGIVDAPIVLRCTEGFTATLPGAAREWLPLNSAQIVTEPLSSEIWAQIGWDGHEIFGDFDHTYCYCQRTREGRIAVGARGVPYKFGSQLDTNGEPDRETIRRLITILHRHFPAARSARIDHAWCGVLGVPRDWCATVGLGDDGIGWAGGYVGVGVSTSNLAGRTLADLALGRDTELSRLPWVNRRVKRWEPEPLRWMGVQGMYRLYAAADRAEAAGGGPSKLAEWGNWLTGRG